MRRCWITYRRTDCTSHEMHFDFTGTEILHTESRHFFSYLPMLRFAFSFPIFGDVHPPTSAILSLLGDVILAGLRGYVFALSSQQRCISWSLFPKASGFLSRAFRPTATQDLLTVKNFHEPGLV